MKLYGAQSVKPRLGIVYHGRDPDVRVGRAFENARDGRRAEKVLVNGAREKVAEMEGLSREMGEWSLLDEAGDMRGARRELDGHEAPARPLDNQVL